MSDANPDDLSGALREQRLLVHLAEIKGDVRLILQQLEWLKGSVRDLDQRISAVDKRVDEVADRVASVEGKAVTRTEAQAAVNRRLTVYGLVISAAAIVCGVGSNVVLTLATN